MINDNMLSGVAALLVGSSYTIPAYLAFGSTTGTLAAADTITSGEFSRTALTSTAQSVAIAKFIGSRSSASANNEYINMVGLHNAATLRSSGNLQGAFLVASLLHTTAFDVGVEFWIEATRV